MAMPHLLKMNGDCGDKAPGLLPVLVGEPMESCPTAMGLHNEHVLMLADLVPCSSGAGALAGIPRINLPPYIRAVAGHAEDWLEAWRINRAATEGVKA